MNDGVVVISVLGVGITSVGGDIASFSCSQTGVGVCVGGMTVMACYKGRAVVSRVGGGARYGRGTVCPCSALSCCNGRYFLRTFGVQNSNICLAGGLDRLCTSLQYGWLLVPGVLLERFTDCCPERVVSLDVCRVFCCLGVFFFLLVCLSSSESRGRVHLLTTWS